MLRAAVIGVGNMGWHHVRVFAQMSGVDVVAVADPDKKKAQRVAGVYRVQKIYSDYRELLDQQILDIATIAVPTEMHAVVACEVLARGVAALVEKPLALTLADGRTIIDAASANGTPLMVGHIERFNPAVREIKGLLNDRELGRIFQVHARRLSPFPGRIADVGVTLDLATHDIDVMSYLLETRVERVYAETGQKAHARCEDLLAGLLRFENGVIGVLDVNWLTPTKLRQLAVLGERGMLVADYLTQDVYWYKNSELDSSFETLKVFRGVREGDMIKLHLQKVEPLQAEFEAFVASVDRGEPIQVSGEDGLAAVGVAEALIQSGREHACVSP